MRYSIEPTRERIYVKGYGFSSLAKKFGTHATEVAKSMSNKIADKITSISKSPQNTSK